MSLGAWGDDGDADRPYTEERVQEMIGEEIAPFVRLMAEILDSDMAQREEDEGNKSPILEKIRELLKTATA